MNRAIFFALVLAITCLSCKKSSPTRTELITGRWMTTAQTTEYDVAGFTTKRDDYSALSECQKDDLLIYESGGAYSLDDNNITCNYGGLQIRSVGNWYIAEPEGQLVQQPTGKNAQSLTILTLDGSTLKTLKTDSVSLGPLRYRSQTTTTYSRR